MKREAVMLTVQIGGSAYLLNSLKDRGALMKSKRESVMMEWLYIAVDENEKYSDLQRMDGLISSTIFLHFVKCRHLFCLLQSALQLLKPRSQALAAR